MAGHHKWSNVKRLKGALEAKRGKLFSKLAKDITLAAKSGGGSPDGNPPLRPAVHTAWTPSVPIGYLDRADDDEQYLIITSHDQLYTVGDSLKRAGLEPDSTKLTYLPEITVPVIDEDVAAQFLRPSDALEDNDDVPNVHANADLSETLLVKIGG